MQIYGVGCDARGCVVGPENVIAGLAVVGIHLAGVVVAFFGELVREGAVAGFICLVGLGRVSK